MKARVELEEAGELQYLRAWSWVAQGIAVAGDDVGDYHFSGQQQMLKQVASLKGLNSLNGGNGSLSF